MYEKILISGVLILMLFSASACDDGGRGNSVADGDLQESDADELMGDGDGVVGDGDVDPDDEEIDSTDGDHELISDGDGDAIGEEEDEAEAEDEGERQETEVELSTACNGHDELCERPFNEISYATTHNAMSNREEGWSLPNQNFSMTRQLADGIRGMMLDAYYCQDPAICGEKDTFLCHGECFIGSKPLAEGLGEITAFLEANTREVMTIFFENYIDAEDMRIAFEEADLLKYVHTQILGDPWPTLGEMVDSGRRLVVFTGSQGGAYDWYHATWSYCWDTDWNIKDPEDFDCDRNRGSTDNDLFILNHHIYSSIGIPTTDLADLANSNPFFGDRTRQCYQETGQLPNYPSVDFYDIGDIFEVVDNLNGF